MVYFKLQKKRQMLNQGNKIPFTKVAMIESQYESKRKNVMATGSSLLSNKSPMRQRYHDRQNYNNINTPSRMGNTASISNNSMLLMYNNVNNGSKISLSPLRSRRNNQSSITSIKNPAVSRRKLTEFFCDQHKSKTAQFIFQSEGECFYFCKNCAIPLIAQGFACVKINQGAQQDQNPRIKQIDNFLKNLQFVMSGLDKKKTHIRQIISKGEETFDGQKQKIKQLYTQFHDIIDEHMSRVIDQLDIQYRKSCKDINEMYNKVNESCTTCNQMKKDIVSSVNSVVLQTTDVDYRSVMDQYHDNLQLYKQICGKGFDENLKIKTISIGDIELVCQSIAEALTQGLSIQWNDQESQINQQSNKRKDLQSERQNPIQYLETEERGKSNLKQLGGLFCSFDE